MSFGKFNTSCFVIVFVALVSTKQRWLRGSSPFSNPNFYLRKKNVKIKEISSHWPASNK